MCLTLDSRFGSLRCWIFFDQHRGSHRVPDSAPSPLPCSLICIVSKMQGGREGGAPLRRRGSAGGWGDIASAFFGVTDSCCSIRKEEDGTRLVSQGKQALMPNAEQRAKMREANSPKQSSFGSWQRPTYPSSSSSSQQGAPSTKQSSYDSRQRPTSANDSGSIHVSANVSPISKLQNGASTPTLRSPGGEELGFGTSGSRAAVAQSSSVLHPSFPSPFSQRKYPVLLKW